MKPSGFVFNAALGLSLATVLSYLGGMTYIPSAVLAVLAFISWLILIIQGK